MSGYLELTVMFWCSDSLVFVAKTPIHPSSSLTLRSSPLRAVWEAVFWAYVLSFVHRIKHNSQLLGCAFFFQSTLHVKSWTDWKTNNPSWTCKREEDTGQTAPRKTGKIGGQSLTPAETQKQKPLWEPALGGKLDRYWQIVGGSVRTT